MQSISEKKNKQRQQTIKSMVMTQWLQKSFHDSIRPTHVEVIIKIVEPFPPDDKFGIFNTNKQ